MSHLQVTTCLVLSNLGSLDQIPKFVHELESSPTNWGTLDLLMSISYKEGHPPLMMELTQYISNISYILELPPKGDTHLLHVNA